MNHHLLIQCTVATLEPKCAVVGHLNTTLSDKYSKINKDLHNLLNVICGIKDMHIEPEDRATLTLLALWFDDIDALCTAFFKQFPINEVPEDAWSQMDIGYSICHYLKVRDSHLEWVISSAIIPDKVNERFTVIFKDMFVLINLLIRKKGFGKSSVYDKIQAHPEMTFKSDYFKKAISPSEIITLLS